MALLPRERIRVAIEHEAPDRPPLDLGGSYATAINVVAYARLCQALGLPARSPLLREQTQSVTLDEELRQILGVDTIGLYERPPRPELECPGADRTLVSEWGLTYRQAEGFGSPYTLASHPLAEATLADLDNYPWPDPLVSARFAGIAEEAARLREGPYAVIGNLGWSEVFGLAWYLRGFENFMVDLLTNKEFARALLRRITDYQKARYAAFLDLVGDALDIIPFMDDMGGQNGLFVSPRVYREVIKPFHAEVLSLIRSRTRAAVMFHSCGGVAPLMDDFVEMGVEILNPVQVAARGMDTAALKQRYGQCIAFWGAVDTQNVLPFGSADDVRTEVLRRIAELGAGGGYVVAPTHVVQADVPPANVLMLCSTASSLHSPLHDHIHGREAPR